MNSIHSMAHAASNFGHSLSERDAGAVVIALLAPTLQIIMLIAKSN